MIVVCEIVGDGEFVYLMFGCWIVSLMDFRSVEYWEYG